MVIEPIDNCNIKDYKEFVTGTFGDNIVAFGAKIDNKACGIIISEEVEESLAKAKNVWGIKNILVDEAHRRQGIGSKLVNTIILKLLSKPCRRIEVNYSCDKEMLDILRAFFLKCGFSDLQVLSVIYRFTGDIFNKSSAVRSAIANSFKIPDNIKILPIEQVDKRLFEKIVNKDGIDYPDNLSPFSNEFHLKSINTFCALNEKDEVIGWLTGLAGDDDLIVYRSFFVREDYRHLAIGFFLYNACIKNHFDNFQDRDGMCSISIKNKDTERLMSLYFKNAYKFKKFEFYTCLIKIKEDDD